MPGFRLQFSIAAIASIAAVSLLATAAVMADDSASAGPDRSQPGAAELPPAVAETAQVLSGVKSVEALADDTFAVHQELRITGSRLARKVTLRIAGDGTVVDWGDTPMSMRTYTLRELRSTGRTDPAEALRRLDPAVHP